MSKVGGPNNAIGKGAPTGLVPMIRLDDYFTGEYAPTVIKIDTERYEMQVLLGAQGLLKRKPHLLIEIHETMTNFGHAPADLHKYLTSFGYRISQIPHRSSVGDDARAVKEVRADEMRQINSMVLCS